MSPKKLVTKAVLMLLAGTIVCAVFSDPLVDALTNFSTVSGLCRVWRSRALMGCECISDPPLLLQAAQHWAQIIALLTSSAPCRHRTSRPSMWHLFWRLLQAMPQNWCPA